MNILFYDILEYLITHFFSIDDLHSLIQINKWYLNNFKELYSKIKLTFRNQLYEKFPIFIINLFSNLKKINDLNKFDVYDNFYGLTDDLDQIKVSDINDSIMYSHDLNLNIFIVLKLKIKIDNQIINTCITVSQKRILNYRWCINSSQSYYRIFFNQIIELSDIEKLKLIINKEVLKIDNYSLWIEY